MTKLCDFKRDNPTVLAWLKNARTRKIVQLKTRLHFTSLAAFSALTLLVGCQEEHLAYKTE